jgi:hypothetical protein
MRAKTTDFRRPNILVISLEPEQRAKLFEEGMVRVDLTERLRQTMDAKARAYFLQQLGSSQKNLDLSAQAYLIQADDASQKVSTKIDLPAHLKVSLGILNNDQAILEIRRIDEHLSEAQQDMLKSHLSQARSMAVVLE